MSRALRINMPGGWYHITARGNERRPIFRDEEDYDRFLSRLAETVRIFRGRISAIFISPRSMLRRLDFMTTR